jgi:signal peptidase I
VIAGSAIAIALAIQAFVVKPYQIPSPSMEPTLDVGQRVLVNRFSYRLGGDPDIGDIVVFHPPLGAEPGHGNECGVRPAARQPCPEPTPEMAETNFIKRVVAGPGDELTIIDGNPVVNGEVVDDPEWNVRRCASCDYPKEITIPADHYFMMGDNRGQSQDSRYWGPVPRDWLIGEAFFTYWPPKRIGLF